jgi:hypothetical protein
VFRRKNPEGITPADFSFRLFTVVGDRETVSESLRVLHREFAARPGRRSAGFLTPPLQPLGEGWRGP